MPLPLPAIVIPAYNRPNSLQRLLHGIAAAHYPQGADVPLVISIDPSPQNNRLIEVAQNFEWRFGTKKVIQHQEHLGLKQHILACGKLTAQFSSLILLEDDLLVSPWFYGYAQEAIEFYEPDEQIAGISLYHYEIAENGFYPFVPIDDGSDVYFMQIASSWGQAWTCRQWQSFEHWLNQNPVFDPQNNRYPNYLKQWSEHSWKKHFIAYLLHSGKYFVFPRLSLTSNSGEFGTNAITKGLFQVPLQQAHRQYRFVPFSQSKAVYDAFFELLPQALNRHTQVIADYDYSIDLYGTKTPQQITTRFVLTTQEVNGAVLCFGQEMTPNVLNIVYNMEGLSIKLAKTSDVLNLQTPPFTRYYRLAAIAEKVFAPLHQYPKISMVLPCLPDQPEENLLKTVQSLAVQHYPNLEIIIVSRGEPGTRMPFSAQVQAALQNIPNVHYFTNSQNTSGIADLLHTGIQNSNGTILSYATQTGIVYHNYMLNMVSQIFSGFGQVNWLSAIPAWQPAVADNHTSLPAFRWNKKRFKSVSLQKALQLLPPEGMFWRKFLWNDAGQSFPQLYRQLPHLGLWSKFWEREQLFTVLRPAISHTAGLPATPAASDYTKQAQQEFAQMQQQLITGSTGMAASVIGLLAKPFYLADMPYLRYLYISMQQFPQVIRYHAPTNSYYLSQY